MKSVCFGRTQDLSGQLCRQSMSESGSLDRDDRPHVARLRGLRQQRLPRQASQYARVAVCGVVSIVFARLR